MKIFRVGVIGCGRISVMHLSALAALSETELVAVCDICPEKAEAAAQTYHAKAYTDYKAMIAEEHLDAVHICLPHDLHTVVAEYAILRGVAVLSEKPMSVSLSDAEHCTALAKEKNVQYGVIFQCRYNNASILVKNALTAGKLGKILSARSTLTWLRPDTYYAESDWKGTWEHEGGGVIIDQAIHSIDLVNWFIDSKVKTVDAEIANRGHKVMVVEDSAEGLITYENGVRYGFWCMNNYACDEPIEIRLCCEKGKAVLSYDYADIFYHDGTTEHAETGAVDCPENAKDYWGFSHGRQIKQFYAALAGKEMLEISAENALNTQRLIDAVYRSGKEKRKIEF